MMHQAPSNTAEVDRAVASARAALSPWADADRISIINRFAEELKAHRSEIAEAICREIGKPRWESNTEVDAMINKVPVSIQAYQERRRPVVVESAGATTATRFKPHGVVAVFGPFNFPGHLPNGHIVPALLAGNTVVFKPSEFAPAVGQIMFDLWRAAGLPDGVLNLVQGAGETGKYLAAHSNLDGLFFTGSAAVGKSLRRSLADHPDKILALEMGGNNPLIVHNVSDVIAAAYHTIQSAFITAGQRCTCARRLIIPSGNDEFLKKLITLTPKITIGLYTDNPEPFMGPVISETAARKLLQTQTDLVKRGGKSLIEMRSVNNQPALLSPGLIDVTAIPNRADGEIFGPLLQLIQVADFDTALLEANHTVYGLSAGLLSDSRELYDKFFRSIRAGVVNWNRPTTGASGSLPFGGVGLSGNHRPSGYYAVDYCSYPIASMETPRLELPTKLPPGITL
jgi:succinylglutamic semialdehyde dehydrogenase